MAFNFYGTFTTGQWEEFKNFVAIQQIDLIQRKAWLQRELTRVGVFITDYDGPNPTGFAAVAGSYADKLMTAYRILGGIPERDMLLRTSDIPVYASRTVPLTTDENGEVTGGVADTFSNNRRFRGSQIFDRDLGILVERLKKWQLEAIKLKRERIEYKIKRALDYSDQIQKEMALIDQLTAEGLGSASDQVLAVDVQIDTPDAQNTVDDTTDIFGLNVGVPSDFTRDSAITEDSEDAER